MHRKIWLLPVVVWGLVASWHTVVVLAEEQPQPTKAAWEWTLEERLTKRFDPVDMERRRDAYAEAADMPPFSDDRCIVDGSQDPELLLPFELLNRLVSMAFSDNLELQQSARKDLAEQAVELSLGGDFLTDLESLTAEVRASWQQERRQSLPKGASERGSSTDDANAERSCQLRAKALAALRHRYGRENLDRFLYQVVAPATVVAMPPDLGWTDRLRFIEGGCQ